MGLIYSKHDHGIKSISLENLNDKKVSHFCTKYNIFNKSLYHWTNNLFLPIFANQSKPNEKDFKIVGKIANGAFGNVYKAFLYSSSTIYAIKVMKKSVIIESNAIDQCKDEAYIQYMFGNYPFVLPALFIWQNSVNLYIVSHYLEHGELYQLWMRLKRFPESIVKIYAVEITLALGYLHKSGIIYRDVKMENLLLDQKGHIQLTDFGLSKWLPLCERTRTICGTLVYMAPEILNEEAYGHECDWWSLGILVYAMLLGKFPIYGAKDHIGMLAKMRKYQYHHLPSYPKRSNEADKFLREILEKNVSKRVHYHEHILNHPFLSNVDIDTTMQKSLNIWDLLNNPAAHNKIANEGETVTNHEKYLERNEKYRSIVGPAGNYRQTPFYLSNGASRDICQKPYASDDLKPPTHVKSKNAIPSSVDFINYLSDNCLKDHFSNFDYVSEDIMV